MARCSWRHAFFCLCSLCIWMSLMFTYILIILHSNINRAIITGKYSPESIHFVASESYKLREYTPLPKNFWKENEEAFWNHLQLDLDRHFNPILNAHHAQQVVFEKDSKDSLLKRTYLKVTALDSMKRKFEQLPQSLRDFESHMEQRDYPLVLQPPYRTCGAGGAQGNVAPLVLLAIKSSEQNFENRQAIRETWGQAGLMTIHMKNSTQKWELRSHIRRVFLLGKENKQKKSDNQNAQLAMESSRYHDILQWDFDDTFFNLSLKDVLFWDWFSVSCTNTRFVFKGDDDIFVNTPNVITYLNDQLLKPHSELNLNDFMVGYVIRAAYPIRLNNSKYFVPETFFTGLYPDYAGGGGLLYSGQLAKRLHRISSTVHLFPIDDVFVGMCMARLHAKLIHHPAFLTFDFPQGAEIKPCAYHTIFLVHKRSPKQIIELWPKVIKTWEQCWNKTLRQW
ncbi:N-acetyllactosaminide beta-1,3-N-acetylglucosaminyltransferase 2-like [Stigmatopora argus]